MANILFGQKQAWNYLALVQEETNPCNYIEALEKFNIAACSYEHTWEKLKWLVLNPN